MSDNLEFLKEKSVLFADDDPDILEVMTTMLKRHFKTIYKARDGKEALEVFKTEKPDFVLTDIEMPKMDGVSLLNNIKEISPDTKIVIVTAFQDQAYRAEKADGIITKPVMFSKLLEILGGFRS